jgi:hypothetical protein
MLMLLAVAVALTFPALSVQVPEADWLAPSLLSVTGFVHEATPEPLSVPVKLTVTSVLFQPWAFGPGEALALAVGGVLSILTAGDVNVLLLPAASVTVTAPVTDAPSDVSISGLLAGFVETTPDRLSVVVKENDTSVLCQPFPFAAGLALPNVTVGGVLSILNAGDVKVALLPALSVTVIVPLTELPSVVRSSGVAVGLVEATPERPSEVVNGTETSVLFQPAAFAAGVAAPNVSVGAVLSMLMLLAVAVALTFPALSVQVPEADCPAPSLLFVTAAVHESIPDRLSAPVKLTVTSVLFQP